MTHSKILILGISGMLGNALFRLFSEECDYLTYGTLRSISARRYFPEITHAHIISNIDVENSDSLVQLFAQVKPDIVINAVGVVKQLDEANNPLITVPINSLLPHRLAQLCAVSNARFIHMSTDCVFSGTKGNYAESDFPDADDLYGRSKLFGEVDYPHAITLRTSIIGTELIGARSLVGWFLAQEGEVKGYRQAIFSGLPTVEIARTIRDYVIPNPQLHGLYHLSVDPISKYELLSIVANTYKKSIKITPDDSYQIDRSLNSERFRQATGFYAKPWSDLVQSMRDFELTHSQVS